MHGGDQNRGADDDADGRPPPPRQDASSIRDRVSFSSSSRPRPSCWGRLKIRRIGRSSTHGRRSGIGGGGGDENGTTTPAAAAAASSRACLGGGRGGRCGCRAVPDAAVGARSLLQRNDFYCDDCNTHRSLIKMGKQKIVLKLALDDERKRRKAFKAAVGMNGVTSATMEGDKIIVVGDGVDPITLTTMLRRSLGYAELLSVSSGDDKKNSGYGSGGGMMYGGGMGYGGSGKEGKEGKESGGGKGSGGGGYGQYQGVAPVSYPAAYQQYNAMPSYPVYYPAAYPPQEQDPGCSIM